MSSCFRSGGALDLVTARTGGTRAGCLVVFAPCQVSIGPERFDRVAISTANYNHRVASAMDSLAVRLLPGSAADLANLFGETTADCVDKLARCSSSDGPNGVPILDGAIGVLVGKIVQRIDVLLPRTRAAWPCHRAAWPCHPGGVMVTATAWSPEVTAPTGRSRWCATCRGRSRA